MTDSVAKRSPASAAMLEAANVGRALMGGTRAMRSAGETYLPKFESESTESYTARLKSSWLFNGYRKTTRDMTGRVFDKPVELNADSTQLSEWVKNIDMAGRDLSTFARDVFEDGISGAGLSFIMVEAPRRDGVITRETAAQLNLRPYLVHLTVEEVLGWKSDTIDNVTRLTQFRIMESVSEQDPKDEFAQTKVPQVRVLDLIEGRVQVRLFRKVKDTEKWALYDDPYFMDVGEITVIPFYANRTGFFTAEPLLDDLADVNVAHWQSQSDQRNILHFARVPILFAAGRPEDEGQLVISAGMAVTATDPKATLKWTTYDKGPIEVGRQDLKDLEFQMEAFGLQLLTARPGAQSATGEALDAAKETSTLSMTADQLQDALEQALVWMGQYGSVDIGEGAVAVNKEFGVGMMNAQDMTAMLSAVNTGNMSRETFLREMARRGMIAPDTDLEAEMDRIETEAPDLSTGANDGFGE